MVCIAKLIDLSNLGFCNVEKNEKYIRNLMKGSLDEVGGVTFHLFGRVRLPPPPNVRLGLPIMGRIKFAGKDFLRQDASKYASFLPG